jgi:hypothetical protein
VPIDYIFCVADSQLYYALLDLKKVVISTFLMWRFTVLYWI